MRPVPKIKALTISHSGGELKLVGKIARNLEPGQGANKDSYVFVDRLLLTPDQTSVIDINVEQRQEVEEQLATMFEDVVMLWDTL